MGGKDAGMSHYIRPRVPGACVFFTVNLVDRGADTMVRHVDVLRQAVAVTKGKRPFGIDAWVVLPDHMHCVWTLPEGDADYSGRWREIKGQSRWRFVGRGVPRLMYRTIRMGLGVDAAESGHAPTYATKLRSGRSGSGNTTSGTTRISRRMCGIVGSTR